MAITLRTAEGGLTLREASGSWWQATVMLGPAEHVLGSDTKGLLVPRLQVGLASTLPAKTAGFCAGIPTAWVASLSEEHCSIYAGDLDDVRLLFFQDANRTLLGSLRLSPREREAWSKELGRQLTR
jgi:hypothetical protein